MRVTREKSVFALLVIALGMPLGAVICALSFAHLLMLQPLPYPEQARLVIAEQQIFDHGNSAHSRAFSYPAVNLVHENAGAVFSASVMMDSARDVIVSHPAQPLMSVNYIKGDYAALFAPPMALGRFPIANAAADAKPTAVISHFAWQSLFDRRADVIGQSLSTAAGVNFEVVGVTAANFVEPEFNGPGYRTSVWLPWQFNPSLAHWGWAATTDTLTLAGRLLPGVTASQASQRLSMRLSAAWRTELGTEVGTHAGWSTRVELIDAKQAIVGDSLEVSLLLLAGTLGLILVVLVNVIHLLVARVAQRAQEFSIQLALGAKPLHVFALVVTDTLLLMLPAGVFALAVAAAGFATMQHYLQAMLPRIEALSVGIWTVAFTICAVSFLGLLIAGIALVSCWPTAGGALTTLRSSAVSKVSRRLRAALMASQIAVAGLLIAVNFGLLREAVAILNAPKIDLERSASAFLYQSPSASKHSVSQENPFGEVKRRLLELPGVGNVSQSHSPLQDFIQTAVASTDSGVQFPVELKRIDHDYLGITGQRMALGRNFNVADIDATANVVMINAALARLLEKEGSALGASLQRKGETPFVVVGVVNELAYPGENSSAGTLANPARIYLPASLAGSNLIVKFRPGFALSRAQLVALVRGVNPGFGVFLYDDLNQQRADIQLPSRIAIAAAAAIALIVIIVSGIGLYGMVSYTTFLRRSEIGARLAFGASARHIVLMLIRDNSAAFAIGCTASATIVWLLLPSLSLWFDVRWLDASVAFGLLSLLAVVACCLSARPLFAGSPAAIVSGTRQL